MEKYSNITSDTLSIQFEDTYYHHLKHPVSDDTWSKIKHLFTKEINGVKCILNNDYYKLHTIYNSIWSKRSPLTIDFLKGKLVGKERSYHVNNYHYSEDVYSFTIYNFLPGKGSRFSGHYQFFVNIMDFSYLVIKDSDYGSLSYVKENKDKIFIELNDVEKIQSENIIAQILLDSYHHDSMSVNSKGLSLFSTFKKAEQSIGSCEGILLYKDGYCYGSKVNLISEGYILEYREIDLLAIKKLNGGKLIKYPY